MDKPNRTYPNAPATSITSVPSPMPNYIHDPSIRGVSFDQLLSQRGIRLIHRKAIPCMNMSSVDHNTHHPDCPFCDDSGIMYYEDKEIWGVFQGNSQEKTFEAHGIWEVGSAVITLPAEYPDGSQAEFNTFDQLIINDFTVRLWEHREYEPTPNGQRLRYPVQKMDFCSSIVDGVQKIYQVGVDFSITEDGRIQWINEPNYNESLERGEVIGYAYFAKPVYVVVQPLRELRITQELVNGVKTARRLPQQLLIRRDFLSKEDKIATTGSNE